MIIETIVTTSNLDGSTNIAPMGPWVNDRAEWSQFELRPFQSSQTFHNLRRRREGVVHITDDVMLFARAIVGEWPDWPELIPARAVQGQVIAGACRWIEFVVDDIEESEDRAVATCRAVAEFRQRELIGFQRARHAVLEACILASRVHLIEPAVLREQLLSLRRIVDRTGSPRELDAFQLLADYSERSLATSVPQGASK